jgi:hypothetical protein
MFFFEKKNQKTFVMPPRAVGARGGLDRATRGHKSFFASFCSQKEDSSSL